MNVMVRRLYTVVNGMPKPLVLIAGIAMIGVLGTVDLLTKNEILFSAFYILPITLIAWFAGGRSAAIVSVLSVSFLFADDISSRLMSLDSVAVYWNNFGRLVFFLIISYLLASLKKAFDRQQALARIDSLTELRNSRAFYEDAGMEIERAKRYKYPLTLGFIDLDD